MAFGDRIGGLTGNGGSVTNPSDATGSVSVASGDLVWAVFGEQTGLTVTGVTDNLGNTYTATGAGVDSGAATGRCFISVVSVPGTLTTVSFSATASAHDWAAVADAFVGPFDTSPIDANPTPKTSDVSTPFTCPPTGTLAKVPEVVLCAAVYPSGSVYSATSPNLLGSAAANLTNIRAVIGYQTVSDTASVTPVFTGTNPSDQTLFTVSLMQAASSVDHWMSPVNIMQAVMRAASW